MKQVRGKRFSGKFLLLAAFLAAAAIFGSLMLHKYQARHATPTVPAQPQPVGTVPVILFFDSSDATGLVRETREIESCTSDTSSCIRGTLEELANGPLGDLMPTIPPNSTFHSVRILDDTAVIDLGKELAEGLPEGSSAEMTAVYSIVDTITFNFPSIKKVRFLVDGKEITTLGGHLDLSKPLEPDFQLEKQYEQKPADTRS